MMYQCTKYHHRRTESKQVIGRNVKFTSLLPEAVCCCLRTCNHCFVMRVIWCTGVPVYQVLL